MRERALWVRGVSSAALLAVVMGTAAAWAQMPGLSKAAPAPAAPQEVAPPPPPSAVSVPEISARSEILQRKLREERDRVEASRVAADIEDQLPATARSIEKRDDLVQAYLEAHVGLSTLDELQREWEGRRLRLATWTAALTRRAEELSQDLASLDEDRDLWRRSEEAAREAGAPTEVIAAVRQNLAEIRGTRARVAAASDRVLRVQSEVAALRARASEVLDEVSRGRARARARLFQADASPLWEAVQGEKNPGEIPDRVRESVGDDVEELAGYRDDLRQVIPGVLVLFLASAGAAFWVRSRLRQRTETGELEGSSQVFARPWSVAILSAGFVALMSLQYAPSLAGDAIGIALIIPVVRLVMPVVNPAFHGLLFSIVAFFFVDQVRSVLDDLVLIERCLFFVETTTLAALLASRLRPSRLSAIPPESRPPKLLGHAMRVGVVTFAVSSLANLTGFLGFARVLGDGTLTAVYVGLAAFALYRVATTAVLIALASRRVEGLAVVKQGRAPMVAWTKRIFGAIAFGWWGTRVLDAFSIWETVRDGASSILFTPLSFGNLSIELGDVVLFVVTVVGAFLLSRAVRFVLQEDLFPRMHVRRGVANASATIASYVVLLVGFFLSVAAAGIDLSAFAFVAGAFGVGIGFGLQNVVNNFISGLILLFERPVQVGDVVQVGTMMGHMTRIGIRSSTLRTWDGSEVILPNATLISDVVTNWTLSDSRRRIDVPVGIAYGTDHETVFEVLTDVTRSCEGTLRDPEPMIVFQGFGDSALRFEVRAWVQSDNFLGTKTRLVSEIYRALGERGIEIALPQRDLHVRELSRDVLAARRAGAGQVAPGEPPGAPDAGHPGPPDADPPSAPDARPGR